VDGSSLDCSPVHQLVEKSNAITVFRRCPYADERTCLRTYGSGDHDKWNCFPFVTAQERANPLTDSHISMTYKSKRP